MAKRMNEFIYLHESEKEQRKESERMWEVGYVGYV